MCRLQLITIKSGKRACLPCLDPFHKSLRKKRQDGAIIFKDADLKPYSTPHKNVDGWSRSASIESFRPKNIKLFVKACIRKNTLKKWNKYIKECGPKTLIRPKIKMRTKWPLIAMESCHKIFFCITYPRQTHKLCGWIFEALFGGSHTISSKIKCA